MIICHDMLQARGICYSHARARESLEPVSNRFLTATTTIRKQQQQKLNKKYIPKT